MQHQIKSLMTRDVVMIPADATLQEAARMMKDIDCGVLPVGSSGAVEGIITDRDIVIRAVAQGRDVSQERVRDYMTQNVFCCSEEDALKEAADKMKQYHVNRLIVNDKEGNVAGIITFGSILRKEQDMEEIEEVIQSAIGRKAA